MEREYERFSVAWIPVPGTALADFGKAWTGWCSVSGQRTPASKDWEPLKEAARVGRFPGQRGLHAPLTRPFALSDEVSRWALEAVLEEFASGRPSEYISNPVVRVDNERVVFAPERRSDRLNVMMTDLQEELRPFVKFESGPMPLDFVLPLTGMIGPRVSDSVLMELAPFLDGITDPKPLIASLSLIGQPCEGQAWRMLDRYVLSGQSDNAREVPAAMTCIGPDLLAPAMSM